MKENEVTKRVKEIREELQELCNYKDSEKAASFLFSYEEDGSITIIGLSSFAHDIALIFSLMEKIKRNSEMDYVTLLLELLRHLMQAKNDNIFGAVPKGTAIQ